jgi:LysR family glycine cleavage system transcriptional activator
VSLTEDPDGGVLNLSILPTFGTYWLAPKLPAFLAENPGTSVRLVTHLDTFDFHGWDIDAAIFFGEGVWNGTQSLRLLDELVVPACSPTLLAKHRFAHPADFVKAPILSLSTRPTAWQSWLVSHGVTDNPPQTVVFDQFATLAQAAKHAAGVALLPWFLVEQDFKSGELVSAYGSPVSVTGSYYLVWPSSRAGYAPVANFVTWLKQIVTA